MIVKIAGFNICIIFNKLQDNTQKKMYERGFKVYVKDFIIKYAEKADFTIEINDKFDQKEKIPKQSLNSLKNMRKIVTYYQDTVSFQILLQNALYILLSQNNGYVIHASSVIKDGKTLLFMGKSSAGKSTIANLLNPTLPVFTDDLIFLKEIDGKIITYQHPFVEKRTFDKKNTRGIELEKIYFLTKSTNSKIRKLKDKYLLIKRMSQQLFVADKITLKNLINLTNNYDIFFRLYFPKNRDKVLELLN